MLNLFTLAFQLKGINISSARSRLNVIQSLGKSDFRKWQNKQKWEIAKYHYLNTDFYRKKIGKKFPDKWEDLPILNKKDYQLGLKNLLSNEYKNKSIYIANTSGSSGHPFYFAKNKSAHALDWALIEDRYNWHGINLNAKQARFYGMPLEGLTYYKEKLKDRILNRIRFPIFDLNDNTLKLIINKIVNSKIEIIYGYANSLVMVANYLLKNKLCLKEYCESLKYCISTSEMLTEGKREILKNAFGVPIINEYGASETGLIAFENINKNLLLSEEILYYEIKDDLNIKDHERSGNIILTDLDNKAMPFIRYNIGDIGSIRDKNKLNDKYKILDNLLGRENDMILLPSGKKSPGLTFYYISKSILESSGSLKEFIIRQISKNTFIFDIVSDNDLSNKEIEKIKGKMNTYLEPGLKIIINRVELIKRPKSGKIKHFFSEV